MREAETCSLRVFTCTCALGHHETFNQSIYKPAVTSFLGQLVILRTTYEWNYTIVFNGFYPLQKKIQNMLAITGKMMMRIFSFSSKPVFVGMCIRVYAHNYC
jgi:hypothetical protein